MIGYHPAASHAAVVTVAESRHSMRSGHAADRFARAGEATVARVVPSNSVNRPGTRFAPVRTRACRGHRQGQGAVRSPNPDAY